MCVSFCFVWFICCQFIVFVWADTGSIYCLEYFKFDSQSVASDEEKTKIQRRKSNTRVNYGSKIYQRRKRLRDALTLMTKLTNICLCLPNDTNTKHDEWRNNVGETKGEKNTHKKLFAIIKIGIQLRMSENENVPMSLYTNCFFGHLMTFHCLCLSTYSPLSSCRTCDQTMRHVQYKLPAPNTLRQT